jgi:hypothetical protein
MALLSHAHDTRNTVSGVSFPDNWWPGRNEDNPAGFEGRYAITARK